MEQILESYPVAALTMASHLVLILCSSFFPSDDPHSLNLQLGILLLLFFLTHWFFLLLSASRTLSNLRPWYLRCWMDIRTEMPRIGIYPKHLLLKKCLFWLSDV
jgi:hypothetical protein